MSVQSQIDRINGTVTEQNTLIQQIKTELSRKESGNAGTPEVWTFTLDDDSTIEKVVYVS